MDQNLRKTIEGRTFFTKEAAEYLGISVQRLNQLVQAQKLMPLKRSSGAMLFLKDDLDLRKEELESTSIPSSPIAEKVVTSCSARQYDAIAYYTIQSFLNYSDKKASLFFEVLSHHVDFTRPLKEEFSYISSQLGIDSDSIRQRYDEVFSSFQSLTKDVRILKKTDNLYPLQLRTTEEATPFLFTQGNIDLLSSTIVAVVGTRHPSEEGAKRASRLSFLLGNAGIVVSSGLANGIDTHALTAAIKTNAPAIGVIGTPINRVYPKENRDLQERIASEGLLISQFGPNEAVQRWFFPLRNGTMSAISRATVIVEAGETSGALKQADYAIRQGRLIFIPQSAIDNPAITWPKKYIQMKGAFRFQTIDDLLIALKGNSIIDEQITSNQLGLFEL